VRSHDHCGWKDLVDTEGLKAYLRERRKTANRLHRSTTYLIDTEGHKSR